MSGRTTTLTLLPGYKRLMFLCALVLILVIGASVVVYQRAARQLRQAAQDEMQQQLITAKVSTEQAIATLIQSMETCARQPAMLRILDDDSDREIDALLDAARQQNTVLDEISCWSAAGKLLAVSGKTNSQARAPISLEEFAPVAGGIRAVVSPHAASVDVTVPIFWHFDQTELLGVLTATVQIDRLLVHPTGWWNGILTTDGQILAYRGPELTPLQRLNRGELVLPSFGKMIQKLAHLSFPPNVRGPDWYAAVLEPTDSVFRSVEVMKRTVGGITAALSGMILLMIIVFSRQQSVLLNQLAQHSHELEIKTTELNMENAMRQRAEDMLQKAYDELELRVEERTEELQKSNALLQKEIAERKQAEKKLNALLRQTNHSQPKP